MLANLFLGLRVFPDLPALPGLMARRFGGPVGIGSDLQSAKNKKQGIMVPIQGPSLISKVFENDVHRTSSPMLNRPLAKRSLLMEFV